MTLIAMKKLLWMLVLVNGDVSGVFLDEPMPDYMTFAECEASASMHNLAPDAKEHDVTYRCVYEYGRPLNTGRFHRRME